MKELDFDELDRAVNSLMKNVPKDAGQKPEEAVANIEGAGASEEAREAVAGSTLPAAPKQESKRTPSGTSGQDVTSNQTTDQPSMPQSSPAQAPEPKSQPPAARRGGRFMDVVPRSTMAKTARVSREGRNIEPSSPVVAPEQPQQEPQASQEAPKAAPSSLASVEPPKSDWPDPLEITPSSKQDTTKEDTSTSEPEKPAKTEPEQPMSSPFLSGTKVDKRPLGQGALAQQEPEKEPLSPESAEDVVQPSKDVSESALPEELSSDLMAIESGARNESELDKKPEEAEPEKKPTQSPIAALPPSNEPAPSPVSQEKPKPVVSSSPAPEQPSGPSTSIPQQYREVPSTGEKSNGAIYDTEAYHAPLAHPEKKKPGWMWVVWIIIILILGAGGGAAVYFLRLF